MMNRRRQGRIASSLTTNIDFLTFVTIRMNIRAVRLRYPSTFILVFRSFPDLIVLDGGKWMPMKFC